MPTVATALVDAAAVVSLVAVWPRHERSVLNLVTLFIAMLAAIFFTLIVVGEAIGGV